MKIKNITKQLFLAASAALLIPSLSSCDDVKENDRYIDMGAANVQRVVLLEDYTGQDCMNCPTAHKVVEGLEELYGENIVAVAVHGGGFGIKVKDSYIPYYVGLATDEGEEYHKSHGLTAWPAGDINRSGSATEHDKWSDQVRKAIETPAEADIDVAATLDNGVISITTEVTPTAPYSGKMQLWVLESGIVAIQKDGTKYIDNYVHNNVLRAAVNGAWGEDFTAAANEKKVFTNSISVRSNLPTEEWNADNLSVVAFIYNGNGVGQAAKVKVTK